MSTSLAATWNVAPIQRPRLSRRGAVLSSLVAAGAVGVLCGGLVQVPGAAVTAAAPAQAASSLTRDIVNTTAAAGLTGLLSLPPALQFKMNGMLGAGDTPFHVNRGPTAWTATSPTYGFTTKFAASGPVLTDGTHSLSLTLAGVGYGTALTKPAAAAPVRAAEANAIQYARGALVERYDNGPLGLSQSFTLAARPTTGGSGELKVALNVGGGLSPVVSRDGTAATFTAEGKAIAEYSGLLAFDRNGRDIPAELSRDGSTLVISVDDRNAVYPLTIDPQVKYHTENSGSTNGFGWSVASVDWENPLNPESFVAVGAPYDDSFASNAGKVYVVASTDDPGDPWARWYLLSQAASTAPAVVQANAHYGWSVDVTLGDLQVPCEHDQPKLTMPFVFAVGGAPHFDKSSTDTGAAFLGGYPLGDQCSIPVHQYWNLAAYFASDGAASDQLGSDVLLDIVGGKFVVGASTPWDDLPVIGSDGGSVRLFTDDAWRGTLTPIWRDEDSILVNSSAGAGDRFGTSFDEASDDGTIVVGSPFDDGSFTDQGSVQVFVPPAGGWSTAGAVVGQTKTLTHAGPAANDNLGVAVVISGDAGTIAAGAPNDDWGSPNKTDGGTVRVFTKAAGGWGSTTTQASLLRELTANASASDRTGSSLGINRDGSYVVVGAPEAENGATANQGVVTTYSKGSGWSTEVYPDQTIAGTGPSNYGFGRSVTTEGSGDQIFVGSMTQNQPEAHFGQVDAFDTQ